MKIIINNLLFVLILGFLWSSETIIGKILIIRGASPFDFPLILNTGPLLIVTIYIFLKKEYSWEHLLKSHGKLSLAGTALTLMFIPYDISYLALKKLSPADVSLFIGMSPIFSLIIGIVIRKLQVTFLVIISVISGITGVYLLLSRQLDGSVSVYYYMIMLLIPICYAASGYFMAENSRIGLSSVHVIFFTNLISGSLFLIANKGWPSVQDYTNTTLYLLGVIISLSAVLLMFYASRKVTSFALSFANQTSMMFAFIFTSVIFSKDISTSLFLPVSLILAGSLLNPKKDVNY